MRMHIELQRGCTEQGQQLTLRRLAWRSHLRRVKSQDHASSSAHADFECTLEADLWLALGIQWLSMSRVFANVEGDPQAHLALICKVRHASHPFSFTKLIVGQVLWRIAVGAWLRPISDASCRQVCTTPSTRPHKAQP